MPLEKVVREARSLWALWKITETEPDLAEQAQLHEAVPGNITNMQKRLEWIAGRMLTKCLLAELQLPYHGLVKDEHGKPFLKGSDFHISLSHSFPYAAAILHQDHVVGIDLEQPKPKLLRVAARVLSAAELADAGTDVVKHCVYWCAKESLIKIHGKKDLVLAENLAILPFTLAAEGQIIGRIIVSGTERLIDLYYRVFPGFVLVFSHGKGT